MNSRESELVRYDVGSQEVYALDFEALSATSFWVVDGLTASNPPWTKERRLAA